jgi:hypothetical protein
MRTYMRFGGAEVSGESPNEDSPTRQPQRQEFPPSHITAYETPMIA